MYPDPILTFVYRVPAKCTHPLVHNTVDGRHTVGT
jgi:hypothetical protein